MQQSSPWHQISAEEALARLKTSASGLTDAEAHDRLARYGPNRLPPPPRPHPLWRLLRQFHNVLIYILLASAAVTAMFGHLVDTAVILAVVLVNAVLGFLQEGRAERALDAIRVMLAPRATVMREGRRQVVPATELAPGDIVLLEPGDKVPADLRLMTSHGLQVQEAVLTGESIPVEKQTAPVSADATPGDRSCMAFSATDVTVGQARGVVVATGADTEIGRISGMLATVEALQTPLLQQMTVFGRWITLVILVVAAFMLGFGYWGLGHDFESLFMAVVGLSVAAIPEGLPAVLTITLAVGVQAMARRNAIVRRLPAIETLGSVSVICTDKTGTLTRNEMSVASLVTATGSYDVRGVGYEPGGTVCRESEAVTAGDCPELAEAARVAALCNDAQLHNRNGTWAVEGDPMEGALLAFAARAGMDLPGLGQQWTRTDTIPFDPGHKFMATLAHDHQQHACILLKGAPEAVLALCQSQRGADVASTPLDRDWWLEQAHRVAGQGQRVLALALLAVEAHTTVLELADIDGQMTLLGIVGLIDPPRPEAIEAVADCHRAGISVKMITGDHAATAVAIAGQVGLRNPGKVITGADLDRLDDAAFAAIAVDTDVFARTTPEHKLRLVGALQAHGLTVAMTGDGVNDAPALKRADAGIAMGRAGSDAAREAAELVLADDNFASIVAAVREGRTVYENIRKVISWTLPTSAGEAATIVAALLLGMTLPITPLQILWVNMVTTVTLGMALAFEPTEAGTMRRPPRPRKQPLLNGWLVWHIALVTALFLAGVFGIYWWAIARGHDIELARTLAMNTLVVMEIFHLLFIRNMNTTDLAPPAARGTRALWLAVGTATAGQFAITYLPPLQTVFATRAIDPVDGLLVIGIGVMLFAAVEVEKQLRLRFSRRSQKDRVPAH